MSDKQSVFETLSKIDVSNHVETIKMKRGHDLKYLSWAWAWNTLLSYYPDTEPEKYTEYQEARLTTHEEKYEETSYSGKNYTKTRTVVDGVELLDRKVPYLTTATGTMVECTVVIDGHKYTESLYVMDNSNKAVIDPDQAQINKTQKRCLVKTLARAGLGLNLYADEDLPMGDVAANDKEQADQKRQAEQKRKEEFEKHVADINKLFEDKFAEALKITGLAPQDLKNSLINSAQKTKPEYNRLASYQQTEYLIELINRSLEKSKEKQSA